MKRHRGSGCPDRVKLARVVDRTQVLGPGPRAVVVVQGCELRCRGCTVPETHRHDGGFSILVSDLVRRLDQIRNISGITLTGGEPFLQAAALTRVIDMLRVRRPTLSAMSYSGYRLEWLRAKGSRAQLDLLERLDLLVDGPYVERLHAPLRWRGSSNQRIHLLTPRHREELRQTEDMSAGMEWSFDSEQNLEWVGVPPVRGFARRLADAAKLERAA